ncbi:hypothetical protein Tco_1554163 [Tanacetum coccineum]
MTTLKFADSHNMVSFLSKPAESEGFKQIVDFLNAHPIKHALTVNPTIYASCIKQLWATIKAKTVNGEVQLQALVDGKKIIITESTVRRDLQLEDAEGVDCLPNATIFEQLTLISVPSDNVADEAVYKELDDSLMRAATTASSLEAKHDSGGGPRRQETMGDTIAQTRILDLETTKTTKGNEIASLKRRARKLQGRNRSRTHKLKRLYKVGLTAKVESSGEEESLGEDASKQGRINAINADEDITLVSVQDDADKEMFDVDSLNDEEVFAEQEVAAKDLTVDEVTLAQALTTLKSVKPKVKGNVIEETSVPVSAAIATIKVSIATTTTATIPTPRKGIVITELDTSTTTRTVSSQPSHAKVQDKVKGIMVESEKPMKKKDQISFDEEIALKLQAEIDEEERIARAEEEKINEANIS